MAGHITDVNLYAQQKHHNAPAQESQNLAPSELALTDWYCNTIATLFWHQNTTKHTANVSLNQLDHHSLYTNKTKKPLCTLSHSVQQWKDNHESLIKRVLGLPLTSPWPNVDVAAGHAIVSRGIKFLFVRAPNLFKSRPFTHLGQLAQNSKAALVERKTHAKCPIYSFSAILSPPTGS